MIRVIATAFALTFTLPALAEEGANDKAPLPPIVDHGEATVAATAAPLVRPRGLDDIAPAPAPETARTGGVSPMPSGYRCGRVKAPSV